jgi:hypothetical protein
MLKLIWCTVDNAHCGDSALQMLLRSANFSFELVHLWILRTGESATGIAYGSGAEGKQASFGLFFAYCV